MARKFKFSIKNDIYIPQNEIMKEQHSFAHSFEQQKKWMAKNFNWISFNKMIHAYRCEMNE